MTDQLVTLPPWWRPPEHALGKKKKKTQTHYDLIRRTNELLPEYEPPMIRRVGEAKLSAARPNSLSAVA